MSAKSADAVVPPSNFIRLPDKEALLRSYKSVSIDLLPTPCVLIDRAKVARNCQRMQRIAKEWQCLFRVHIKTHKTKEGTTAQIRDGERGQSPLIVSTLAEAWGVINSGLVEEEGVTDILYGLPIGVHKINELLAMRECISSKGSANGSPISPDVKVMVDNVTQVEALQRSLDEQARMKKGVRPLFVYVKIDCGYHRAGLTADSPALRTVLERIGTSPLIALWGVYCHAGHSYSSKSRQDADGYLTAEVKCVNEASKLANAIFAKVGGEGKERHRIPLVLSVGSTPTAHAAIAAPSANDLQKLRGVLHGDLELHAGNYSFLDLQQVATRTIPNDGSEHGSIDDCSLSLLATVIGSYPGRGSGKPVPYERGCNRAELGDEAIIDAGGIALSKDVGQFEGYGHVVEPAEKVGWMVAKVSQEHGVMSVREGGPEWWAKEWGQKSNSSPKSMPASLQVGEKIRIIPQHACMVAAAHSYFFIFDSDLQEEMKTVQDVWVPWKGW